MTVAVRIAESPSALALELPNVTAALEPARQAMHDFLVKNGIGERKLYDAELVFEELFINIVRYGYADALPHRIDVGLHLTPEDIVLRFDDDGRAFDPTAKADPVLPTDIDDAKIGGLGIMLVRKAARAMEYQRTGGRNTLQITLGRT